MTPRKLKVYFAFFPYGGNGGFASEHPAIRNWFPRVLRGLWADERVSEVEWNDFNDTPITMTRNAAVNVARKRGADVLVMVDSDMHPDHALEVQNDQTAKPFISSSFDKIYEHWDQGPLVICAPYCGAPLVEENVFVFRWTSRITDNPDRDWRMEQYPRFEAQNKIGFEEVAAAATGLMMVDMRAFQITEPEDESEKPWFYYEYRDKYHDEKVSTEDVTFLRDTSMMGLAKLGYNPVLVNWDAWAGHYKPKCVSKPRVATADKVSRKHARAWAEAVDGEWRDLQVGHGEGPSIAIPQELVQKFLELGGVIPQDRLTAALQNDRGTGVFTAEQLGVEVADEPVAAPKKTSRGKRLAPKAKAKPKTKPTKKPTTAKAAPIDIDVIKKLIKDQLGRVDKGTVLCVNAGNDTAVSKAILEAGRKVKLAESVTGKRDTVHLAVVGARTAIGELMPRMKKSGVICGRITPEVEADLKKLGTQVVVRTESNVWWIRCGHACLGRGSSQAFGIRA